MKRSLYIMLFVICILYGDSARSEDILGIGDSIAHGFIATGNGDNYTGAWPTLGTALSMTYYNGGVDGSSAAQCYTGLDALMIAHTPSRVYVEVGSNDVRWVGTSLSSYLSSLDSIKARIVSGSATMYMCQITPVSNCCGNDYGRTETGQTNEKLWNAAIEAWCVTNSVALCPTYQEIAYNSVSYEDDIASAYDSADGVHLTLAGYQRMGTLMVSSAVPIKKRIWGHTSFPAMCYPSWDWWVNSGGAEITGDADTGTLSLPQNATSVSSVECMPTGSKTVQISGTVTAGAVSYSYRTAAATNFDRDDAGAWTAYSGAFTTTDQFIQVKIENTAAGTATLTDATLDWTGDVPADATFRGIGGTAIGWQ